MKKLLNSFFFLSATGLLALSLYNTFFLEFSTKEYIVSFKETKAIAKRFKASIAKTKQLNQIAKNRAYNAHLNINKANKVVKKEQIKREYHPNITESLNLNLSELYNSSKFKRVLRADEVEGNLIASEGTIESLEVAFPDGEVIEISMSKLNGSMFNYRYDGEIYSGLFYQIQNNSYMITLSNGPFKGTRMKFEKEKDQYAHDQEQVREQVAANNAGFSFNQ
jgi:ribosomal protein L35